jgi:hypothetical protein
MIKYAHKKRIITISILIIILTLNIQVISQNTYKESDKEEIVIIKIREDSTGQKATYMNINLEQTQKIIEKLEKIIDKLNKDEIDEITYFDNFLKIFQEENIIPEHCNIELLLEIYNLIYQNITLNQDETKNSEKPERQFGLLDNEIPIHLGRRTIIASLGIGNYLVKRIIPIRPFGFIDIMNKEILRRYNLTSTFSYALACMWTPGPSGHHVLHSLIPLAGFENFSEKIFIDKAIGGIFILGLNISLEAFSRDGTKVYFDATIGIYGADLMIGF